MTRRLAVSRAVLIAAIVTTACGGDDAGVPARDAAALRSTNACEVREAGSRWAPPGGRYAAVAGAEYGRREGEKLADVWGLAATPAGEVFILDAGNTRVVELDRDLKFVRTFGREGQGPGEFRYQRVSAFTAWAAADDSSLFIMDLQAVSEFDPNTLLRADTMPSLPRVRGRVIRGGFNDQAEPLWAVHRRCAFVSDGAGDWILRVDLRENRGDTLPLPPREIPARTAEDKARLEQNREMIVGFMARFGVSTAELRRVQPTARLKWSGMTVDPDGFVWLEPWRPHSMQDDPLTVWVVDPATGAVDSVVVTDGQFPRAFLPDGRSVSLPYDTATGVRFVRLHALLPATE